MTDNKKTIDGVDVSECCNYDDTQFWECEPSYCHCEELPNCNYKQLKRAEQKLEKIKEILSYCEEQVWCMDCKYKDECGASGTHLNNIILQIIEGEENGK